MKRGDHPEPSRAAAVEAAAFVRFSVSAPDDQGNCFITVLGDDGSPLPAREPSRFDREGA